MESYKLSLLILIAGQCIAVYASSAPFSNQVWWTKRTKQVQTGCGNTCCSGKNSTCYGYGPKMGNKHSSSGHCFCDEGCLDMRDCCEDYSAQCQAVNCAVGEWEEYGDCSKPCGLGSKSRVRQVIQEPRNGGQKCPVLKENTVCIGKRCKTQRHLGSRGRADRETARIMPATFGQYRGFKKYNAHMDIRKNLFYKYYAHRAVQRRGYCAIYQITSARKQCQSGKVPWAKVLEHGSSICVECQAKAMDGSLSASCIGHGTTGRDTFWTAVNAHGCHGWWRRTNDLSECSCNNKRATDFIFV